MYEAPHGTTLIPTWKLGAMSCRRRVLHSLHCAVDTGFLRYNVTSQRKVRNMVHLSPVSNGLGSQ